ncbi:MAG: hypothetical protein IKG08_09405 [Eubacterium sp.]|nr:hypothetical protein [Eubacterium sp.]MBR3276799.1 hypothetical protein [Eubacterium sp.]
MNSHSANIKSDIDSFQGCVQKLSGGVQSASFLWRDAQYASLASGISAIALHSRDVLVSGDRLCDSINAFFAIAEEEY